MPQINSIELAFLRTRATGNLMIFDLRGPAELEKEPYAIQDALLTFNVNLEALVPWIPQETIVVLYATTDLPAGRELADLRSRRVKFYRLKDGLRAWREAGLPTEEIAFSGPRLLDDR